MTQRRDGHLLRRRTLLGASTAPLWGCSTLPSDATPAALSEAALQADFIALGELHDNPHHHQARATWAKRWRPRFATAAKTPSKGMAVVVEHLPRGADLRWPDAGDLLPALMAQGFDAKGWRWPLHQALFEGLRAAGCPVQGGNLPKELVRRVVREGIAILDPVLQAWLSACPLSADALAHLERQLQSSHCQGLPPQLIPGMVLAQRARDAAMADTMAKAFEDGHRPVVLLAGNGHTRRDWGVPLMLNQRLPHATCVAVALTEVGQATAADDIAAHDVRWVLPAVSRPPYCPT